MQSKYISPLDSISLIEKEKAEMYAVLCDEKNLEHAKGSTIQLGGDSLNEYDIINGFLLAIKKEDSKGKCLDNNDAARLVKEFSSSDAATSKIEELCIELKDKVIQTRPNSLYLPIESYEQIDNCLFQLSLLDEEDCLFSLGVESAETNSM